MTEALSVAFDVDGRYAMLYDGFADFFAGTLHFLFRKGGGRGPLKSVIEPFRLLAVLFDHVRALGSSFKEHPIHVVFGLNGDLIFLEGRLNHNTA